ncbi:MAG: hypothetical protein KC469_11400 [Flavobacteriaceae bacterium]|nr:hypothetical protein [Flavobacteriaceae bacterium]
MKTLKLLMLCLLITACTSSCSSDDDSGNFTPNNSLKLSDLEGSWIANSALFTNNSNSTESFDMVANGGEIRYTMLVGGGTRTWIDFGNYQDEWDSQASLSGNILTMTPAEENRGVNVFLIEKEGDVIILTNSNDNFDFTLTGETAVSSTSVTTLIPNN